MTAPFGHLGRRVHDVLAPADLESLWHCEICESGLYREVAFSTEVRLNAHITLGHPDQSEEDLERERQTVRHIDAQVIPEPTPVEPTEAELWETIAVIDKATAAVKAAQEAIDERKSFDVIAERIFKAAIEEGRCGELLNALFDGGTATVDAGTGLLAILDGPTMRLFGERSPY